MVSFTNLQKKVQEILVQAISQKIFPGAVIGIVTKDRRLIFPFGKQTYEKKSIPIVEDSMFDIASVTKSIPTSLLALKLIEKKTIGLHQAVQSILPKFQGKWKHEVTIFHLLTQTVDFGLQLSNFKNKNPDEIIATVMGKDLLSKPGTTYSYTNSTSIVLGFVLEKASGKTLATLAQEVLFDNLNMKKTTFLSEKSLIKNIVPTEIDPWRGRIIQGEIHDESAYTISKMMNIGSAGLFSTAPDLLNVLEMLLNEGVYKRKKIFEEKTVKKMFTNQLKFKNIQAGLGWEMDKKFMGSKHSIQTIGKTGFTGCSVFMDYKQKIGIVILSNYHFPKRKTSQAEITKVRAQITDSILKEVSLL